MARVSAVALAAASLCASGCNGDRASTPEQIVGRWQVHALEIASGVVPGSDALLASYPDCLWGRELWTFEAEGDVQDGQQPGHLSHTTDVLCPVRKDPRETEFYGCTVTARVPASWDVAGGKWVVADGTRARSRTLPMDTAAIPGPTSCEAKIDAGDYPVARIRGEKWRWEIRTPDGAVSRLKEPDTERPDFVTALLDHDAAAGAAQQAAPAPATADGSSAPAPTATAPGAP